MKRTLILGAMALSVALIAAACGSDEKASETTPADTGAPASATTEGGDTAAVTDDPNSEKPQGGILKMAINEPLDQWDGQAYYGIQWQMEYSTMNCLLDFFPLPGPEETSLIPGLAADLPTVSPDGLEYTFTIRDGLVYSDGTPVQASDVKAYMERVLNPSIGYDGALGSGYYSIIEGVDEFSKANDDGTPAADRATDISGITVEGNQVKFKLTKANPDFNYLMSLRFICPQKPGGPSTRTNAPEPTTGPYMISNVTDKLVQWVRNPNWDANAALMGLDQYKGKIWNLDGFDLEVGDSVENILLRLKNNELDMMWGGGSVTSLAERTSIENDPALSPRFFSPADPFVRYIGLNHALPPFDNLAVRQAFNYAIDRESMVKISGDGSPWSQILGAALTGDDAPAVFPTTPDLEKAKALIAESGVATPIKIDLMFNETPPNPDIASNVKSQLEQVGFEVTLQPKPAQGFYSFAGEVKNAMEAVMAGWAPDWPDGSGTFGPLLAVHEPECNPQNIACVNDSELDAKIAEYQALPYGADRNAKWVELSQTYAAEKTPWGVWKNGEELHLLSERLGGFYYNAVKLTNMDLLYFKP
jgi:peptide/nickel transport system substrate-binding protein